MITFFRTIAAFALLLVVVAVAAFLAHSSAGDPVKACPPVVVDGLSQAVFDTTVRVRNSTSTGSGSVVADLGDFYEVESNRHVAGDSGASNVIDVWRKGDLVASKRVETAESWFEDNKSKDLATMLIAKSSIENPMAVVPTAPAGYTDKLYPGQMIFTCGCSDGRWPRARCANVLKVEGGLIWYDPKSIGGDSGSGVFVYDSDDEKWYCIGRTAWAIREGRRWVGLAMTSDRVRAIREGRVSSGWKLPAGALPIDEIDFESEEEAEEAGIDVTAAERAVRLDLMPTDKPTREEVEAEVAAQLSESGLFRRGEDSKGVSPGRSMPIREGFGKGLKWIGFGLGIGIALSVLLLAFLFFGRFR